MIMLIISSHIDAIAQNLLATNTHKHCTCAERKTTKHLTLCSYTSALYF